MTQPTPVPTARLAEVAGRILTAWHNGESGRLQSELEQAQRLAARTPSVSTLEMESMEVLSSAVESLTRGPRLQGGAVRLLEHLASHRLRPLVHEMF